MRSIPQSMQPELAKWNGGSGIDLEAWISCSGSFNLAVGYAEYFWPEFVLLDGYIVRSGISEDTIEQWEKNCGGDRKSIEATINHFHLIDINYHDHENLSQDILMRLGTILAEIYDAKLKWQFPDRPCEVAFMIPDDPSDHGSYQISFWQKAHDEGAAKES